MYHVELVVSNVVCNARVVRTTRALCVRVVRTTLLLPANVLFVFCACVVILIVSVCVYVYYSFIPRARVFFVCLNYISVEIFL